MKKIDTHIHGHFSSDSTINYQALCQKAIALNYHTIAFTDHFDLIDTELINYGLFPLERYFREMNNLKKQFPELNILAGIELGEPHRVTDFSQRLFGYKKPD